MRKRLFFASIVILLMAGVVFSQEAAPPREPIMAPGKTNFVNISVGGLNKSGTFGTAPTTGAGSTISPGVPGYIEMLSSAGYTYYLFVDSRGDLRIASYATVGARVLDGGAGWADGSGTVVGAQSGTGL